LPDFRRRIVGCTGLGLHDICLRNFADVEVSKFYESVRGQEDVSALDVSVHNFLAVKSLETHNHLIENGPDVGLFHMSHRLFECVDLGLQVATIGILHHYAEC
jgi:hypothetical protein